MTGLPQCCGCHRPSTLSFKLPSGRIANVCDQCFAARPQPSVYFVRCGDLVKIGYSGKVAQRVRSLRTASATPLELWHVCAGDRSLEADLHGRFAADRSHGEWFHVSDAIERYVAGEAA